MELKQAVQILKDHNEWRRDNISSIPISRTTRSKELGIAIDVIVDHLDKNFYCRPFERGMIENKCITQCLGCEKR